MDFALTGFLFLVGGMVQGCMGFGLALVVAPPLLLHMPAAAAVPMMAMASLPNTALAGWSLRRHAEPRMVWLLALGSAGGLPLGIYLLTTLDGPVFKAGVGALMVALAALMISGWRWELRRPERALLPVGFASGFLGGSISISGPPIILFLSDLGIPRDVFRANSLAYFTLHGLMQLAGFAVTGLLSREVAWRGALLIPVVFLGTQIGLRLATRLGQVFFQRVTLGAAAVMGMVLFVRSMADLL
jgi:uncharacterized membrane protein YfcA